MVKSLRGSFTGISLPHPKLAEGDVVTLTLPMPVRRLYGNPQVRQQAGKVALQRGPLVYCLEEADNGTNLHNLSLPRQRVPGL
jgi:DUF1680 family protein